MLRSIDRERIMSRYDSERKFAIELKACPFCDNPEVGIYMGPIAHVTCRRCGADGPVVDRCDGPGDVDGRQRAAVVRWNDRPD